MYPYIFYFKCIKDGFKSDYINLPKRDIWVLKKEKFFEKELSQYSKKVSSRWQKFNFGTFLIDLPYKHPEFSSEPIIYKEKNTGKWIIGYKIHDRGQREIFSFKLIGKLVFDLHMEEQKLFTYPIFKNYILSKGSKKIWTDIFTKDLDISINSSQDQTIPAMERIKNIWKVSYKELIYNLYVYYLRLKFVDEKASKIIYVPSKRMGIIEWNKSEGSSFLREKLYIPQDNEVYIVEISSKSWISRSRDLRANFIDKIQYSKKEENISQLIYGDFKELPYEEKISLPGLQYLFSALSIDLSNKSILKELIFYLERGKSNFKQLEIFYKYAYKRFGESLSSEITIHDLPEEKLKKKIVDELKEELTDERKKEIFNYEGNFETEIERRRFFIEKSKWEKEKKKKKNILKDSEDVLIEF